MVPSWPLALPSRGPLYVPFSFARARYFPLPANWGQHAPAFCPSLCHRVPPTPSWDEVKPGDALGALLGPRRARSLAPSLPKCIHARAFSIITPPPLGWFWLRLAGSPLAPSSPTFALFLSAEQI